MSNLINESLRRSLARFVSEARLEAIESAIRDLPAPQAQAQVERAIEECVRDRTRQAIDIALAQSHADYLILLGGTSAAGEQDVWLKSVGAALSQLVLSIFEAKHGHIASGTNQSQTR